jgi:hypothetical protein
MANNQSVPFYQSINLTKRFRLLTEKRDPSGNVYIYMKGVGSLAAGDFVSFDGTGTPARTGATSTGPIAVSMSANTTSTNFSWYLVDGKTATANVATHASGAGKGLFVNASASRATTTPLTEGAIYGAFSDGNSVSNVGPVLLRRPVAPGDIST